MKFTPRMSDDKPVPARTPDGVVMVRRLRGRWAARRYAERHGYFWLPCLTCGQWNGGQEWTARGSVPNLPPLCENHRDYGTATWEENGGGLGLCPACYAEGVHVPWVCVAPPEYGWCMGDDPLPDAMSDMRDAYRRRVAP